MSGSPRSVMFFEKFEDAIWDEEAAKTATPLPANLVRNKSLYSSTHAVKSCNEENEKSEEDEKFEIFKDEWAKQDAENNFKSDLLDEVEDAMEAVMTVADKIVRLNGKIKRSLRASKK